MKTSIRLIIAIFICTCLNVFAQVEKPPNQSELDAITNRGKILYEYDQAGWHSTDAVMALKPSKGSIEKYIAQKTDKGFVVAYGKFSEKKDKFLIKYRATQGKTKKIFKVETFTKPLDDTDFFFKAAKAHQTVLDDFIKTEKPTRPYNFAVIPTASKDFFIYVLPAQTKTGVFPLGGDIRYTISKDGSKILKKHRMHNSIIEVGTPPPNMEVTMGYHTAILDNVPEDSCVFHVLTRNMTFPELVLSDKFAFLIETSGSIKYLMSREEFMKNRSKNSNQ